MIANRRPAEVALEFITSELARTGAAKGDLAQAMGITASALSKILKEQRQIDIGELYLALRFFDSPHDIGGKLIADLFPDFSDKFKVAPADKRPEVSDEDALRIANTLRETSLQLTNPTENFFVVKTAQGQDKDSFVMLNEVSDARPRPPGLASMRKVMGIYMAGPAGAPRYEDGELILYDLTRSAAAGDYAIVEGVRQADGEIICKIGRIIDRTSSHLTFELIRGRKPIEVPLKAIGEIRRIIPLTELLR